MRLYTFGEQSASVFSKAILFPEFPSPEEEEENTGDAQKDIIRTKRCVRSVKNRFAYQGAVVVAQDINRGDYPAEKRANPLT